MALLSERHGLCDGRDDSRSRQNHFVPASDERKFVEGRANRLMTPHPSEMGNVCDAVLDASSVWMTFENLVEHAQRPIDLRQRPRFCLGLRRRLDRYLKRLQERRAEAGCGEEKLLEELAALGAVFRKKLPGLLCKVYEDRGRLAEYHVAVPRNGSVDENRDFCVGIQ